jgi:hypothetical protein
MAHLLAGGDTCSNADDSLSSSRPRFLGSWELELRVVAATVWDATEATNLRNISPGGRATYVLIRRPEKGIQAREGLMERDRIQLSV